MKRLLGGYLILNLCMLSMTLGTSQVSITNEEALEQLRNLRDHIQKDYDFTRPLNNQIKPIQLRIRDQKNGEKQESVVWGNLAIFDTALKFKIEALVDSASMKALQIEVVFEEKTDGDGNKYFDIKTAKYLYTESAINYEGITKLENIEDKDGNKRFADYVFTPEEITGLTFTYAKASLSGSHLLIVLAGTALANTVIADNSIIAVINLPKWIKDKIYPTEGSTICNESVLFYKENASYVTEGKTFTLTKVKVGDNVQIDIRNIVGAQTITNNSSFRIAFDLLIDNE